MLTAWWLLPAQLPPLLAFGIVPGATAGSCRLLYRLGGEIFWLRPLIGLGTAKPNLGRCANAILRVRPS